MTEQLGKTTAPWARILDSLDIGEVRLIAAQTEELAQHPAWQRLADAVTEKVEALNESLLPPTVKAHAEYIGITSQIFGMRLVTDLPEAIRILAQRREDEETKAAQRAARTQENRP